MPSCDKRVTEQEDKLNCHSIDEGGDEINPNLEPLKGTKSKNQEARKQELFALIKEANIKELKEAALASGLIDDEIRAKAWPLLLGLKDLEPWKPLDESTLKLHPEYHQVVLDVDRSIKRFPPSIEDARRTAIQDELVITILSVLARNKGLHYYQGFHDVAVTILLVVKSDMAGHIIEKISNDHLRPFLEPTMEKTSDLLEYIYILLKRINMKLYDHLDESGVGTIFCLSWFITWFSHTVETYDTVVRLFDYFLAFDHTPGTDYLMPLYLIVSIIEHLQAEILETECEMSALHLFLSKGLDGLDFEKMLKNAAKLYEAYPPESLKIEFDERIKNREAQRLKDECRRELLRDQRKQKEMQLLRQRQRLRWYKSYTGMAVVSLVSVYLIRVMINKFGANSYLR